MHIVTGSRSIYRIPKGEKGEKGDPGKDGMSMFRVEVSPNPLVFNQNTDGSVDLSNGQNQVKLTFYYGTQPASIQDGQNMTMTGEYNCDLIGIKAGSGPNERYVTIGKVTNSKEFTDASGNKKYVPVTNGYVMFDVPLVSADGKTGTVSVTIPFEVNINTTIHEMVNTDEQFKNRLNNFNSSGGTLEQEFSEINQTVNSISLKVGQTYQNGYNMLPNARLRACIQQNTEPWKVQLTQGKKYTLTARCACSTSLLNSNQHVRVYAWRQDASQVWIETYYLEFKSTDWEIKTTTFTAGATDTWYVAPFTVDAEGGSEAASNFIVGYIDAIQLEEGGKNTFFSPQATDMNTKANLLTKWEPSRANYIVSDYPKADGTTGTVYHLDNTSGTSYKDIVESSTTVSISAMQVYTLSFYAKGSGTLRAGTLKSTGSFFSGIIDGNGTVAGIGDTMLMGFVKVTVSSEWQRCVLTFSSRREVTAREVNIAVKADKESEIWVYGMKFEKGGIATDGNIQAGLLATGIDIDGKDGVTVTAGKFKVRNQNGTQTFLVDEDGTIRADRVETSSKTNQGDIATKVYIHDGIMEFLGVGQSRIVFGADNDGFPVVNFYDAEGKFLYNLGPDGIGQVVGSAWWEEVKYVNIKTELGITDDDLGKWINGSSDKWSLSNNVRKMFVLNSKYETKSYYIYHAAKNGADGYLADGENGFGNAELAKEADGRLFAGKNGSSGLVSGKFMMNNGSSLPFRNTSVSLNGAVTPVNLYWATYFSWTESENGYMERIELGAESELFQDIQAQYNP